MGYQSISASSVCKANAKYHPFGFMLSGIQNDLHMIANGKDDMQAWIAAVNAQIKAAQIKSASLVVAIDHKNEGLWRVDGMLQSEFKMVCT